MKKSLLSFIKTKYPNTIEVIDYYISDNDDDYGFAGEHYLVTCLVNEIDHSSPSMPYGAVKKDCLVNRQEFSKWYKKEESIKWL